jgi:hypothetical protein
MSAVDRTAILVALALPAEARVDQRVPKKLFVENGAPTAADKRLINENIDELHWHAALKPATIGVPDRRDETREYLEIAVVSLILRSDNKVTRLAELVHRAIPYPVFLILVRPGGLSLSLAHLRWSLGQSAQMVIEGSPSTVSLDPDSPATPAFLASLNAASQPQGDLWAFYQGWISCFEAHAAATITGTFSLCETPARYLSRRESLVEYDRLTREIAGLRASATKEKQLSLRVELNLRLKDLESRLQSLSNSL